MHAVIDTKSRANSHVVAFSRIVDVDLVGARPLQLTVDYFGRLAPSPAVAEWPKTSSRISPINRSMASSSAWQIDAVLGKSSVTVIGRSSNPHVTNNASWLRVASTERCKVVDAVPPGCWQKDVARTGMRTHRFPKILESVDHRSLYLKVRGMNSGW